ncbi:aminodeoxychorismate lyase [Alkalihalobacillus sp. LMS39]|uniref:aminodeoxychorismate lyase n=1 Tax=Alkalihalobacillus sp. LMS39 TaxID=2924032 RepID=UPI001FB2CB36|nr:aminodeoxychorismate lyase [Alkalihalobacillus sp. LMS39]UOE94213.1 aminodeoxychorismate lyase [Alkalihalobacillus sp. LMS39]
MKVYLNGHIVDGASAQISIFDHGFMYGLGVFETFRIYEGHPFLLDDHFQRLQKSLHQLGIAWSYDKKKVCATLDTLLCANGIKDAYVRWNVSAGVGPLGLHIGDYEEPTTIVYMKPIPSFMPTEKQAVLLQTRRNSPEGKQRLKSHHYMNNILGKRELGQNNGDEGIFLTKEGYIAEGIVSNVFWVKDDILYTPSLETGILDGITRQFIFALAKKENVHVVEGCFFEDALLEADEMFITNSIQEIVKITMYNGKSFSFYGGITEKLQKQYEDGKTKLWSKGELG